MKDSNRANYRRSGELPVEYRSDLYGTHDCIIVETKDGKEYVGEVALIAMMGINIEDPEIKIFNIANGSNSKVRYRGTEPVLKEDEKKKPTFRF